MLNILFLYLIKQMPHGDGRLQNHNVSYMHTYCPGAPYLSQGLSSSACVPPIFSLEDNNNSSCAQTLGTSEWHKSKHTFNPISLQVSARSVYYIQGLHLNQGHH